MKKNTSIKLSVTNEEAPRISLNVNMSGNIANTDVTDLVIKATFNYMQKAGIGCINLQNRDNPEQQAQLCVSENFLVDPIEDSLSLVPSYTVPLVELLADVILRDTDAHLTEEKIGECVKIFKDLNKTISDVLKKKQQ